MLLLTVPRLYVTTLGYPKIIHFTNHLSSYTISWLKEQYVYSLPFQSSFLKYSLVYHSAEPKAQIEGQALFVQCFRDVKLVSSLLF